MRIVGIVIATVVLVALVIGAGAWGHERERRADVLERWAEEILADSGEARVPADSRLAERQLAPLSLTRSPWLWVRGRGIDVSGRAPVAAASLGAEADRQRVADDIEDELARLKHLAPYTRVPEGPPLLLVEEQASVGLVRVALGTLEAVGQSRAVVAFLVPRAAWMHELEESETYRRYAALPDEPRARDAALTSLIRSSQPLCPALWSLMSDWPTCPPDMKSILGAYWVAWSMRSWACVGDVDAGKALVWAMVGERPIGGREVEVRALQRRLRRWPGSATWGEVLEAERYDGEAAGGDDTAGHGVRPALERS